MELKHKKLVVWGHEYYNTRTKKFEMELPVVYNRPCILPEPISQQQELLFETKLKYSVTFVSKVGTINYKLPRKSPREKPLKHLAVQL